MEMKWFMEAQVATNTTAAEARRAAIAVVAEDQAATLTALKDELRAQISSGKTCGGAELNTGRPINVGKESRPWNQIGQCAVKNDAGITLY